MWRCLLLVWDVGRFLKYGPYLEGRGDFVSRLITTRTHIVALIMLIANLLTKPP